MKFTEVTDKLENLVNVVAPVAGALFPKAQIPLIIAKDIIDNVKNVDEKATDDLVFGLSEISMIIDEVIYNLKSGKEVNMEKLQAVSKNIKVIDKSLDNFYRLIS